MNGTPHLWREDDVQGPLQLVLQLQIIPLVQGGHVQARLCSCHACMRASLVKSHFCILLARSQKDN